MQLKNQYHLWSHNFEHTHWTNFLEKLSKDFSIIKKNIDQNKTRSKKEHFVGFKLKKIMYKFKNNNDNDNIIENFLYEKCDKNPFYQINHTDIYIEYEKFTKNFSSAEKEKLDNYLDVNFIRKKVGTVIDKKDNRIYGWAGLNLKTNKIVVKKNTINAKKIKQINSTGTIILNTFNTQKDAAKYLSISAGALSTNMKKGILINDPISKEQTYFRFILKLN